MECQRYFLKHECFLAILQGSGFTPTIPLKTLKRHELDIHIPLKANHYSEQDIAGFSNNWLATMTKYMGFAVSVIVPFIFGRWRTLLEEGLIQIRWEHQVY